MVNSMNRRQALKTISTSFGSLAFAAMATGHALAARGNGNGRLNYGGLNYGDLSPDDDPLAPKETHFAPRAKNVIVLFMGGAPSHVDTFDYKPKLIKDGGRLADGQRASKLMAPPWKFKQRGESGLWMSDLFPNLSEQADELCLLRGMHCSQASHIQASQAAHTGTAQFIRPSLGAWSLYGLGTENSDLPGFVALGKGAGTNFGSGFLPAAYQATAVNPGTGISSGRRRRQAADDGSSIPNVENEWLDKQSQRVQLDFLQRLNAAKLKRDVHQPEVEGIMQSYELAFRMQTTMPELMDLSNETQRTKDAYGIGTSETNAFGTQCLLARRMVESGVRFVELSNSGWDHHTDLKGKMEAQTKQIDKPIAALLADLKQRGLLKDTLVVWAGEFGRTPHVEGSSGRGHNNKGYTTWMAGGGVKGGFSYGATDDYGYEAVEGRMHTNDWHATILHLLGLDHEKLTYRYAGRDFRLTDVAGKVAKDILA